MTAGGLFVVVLGRHKADGRELPRGELGEFSFNREFLNRKDQAGATWVFENRPPKD
jgi:hypothetical protein